MIAVLLLLQLTCGAERHAVKAGMDPQWASVQQHPQSTTVRWLRAQPHPAVLHQRAAPVETQVWTVRAVAIGWKQETDQDYHLVIADPRQPAATMIVEAVAPACTTQPRLRVRFAAVRHALQAHLGNPTATFRRFAKPVPITLTGVGFFDFCHGQTGRAPNCIEIHPVLGVTFP